MAKSLSDEQVQARIEELEQEERKLRRDEGEAAEADADEQVARDAQRLEAIRIELDQLWDYLRQRRALRDAGQDPDNAQMRDPGNGRALPGADPGRRAGDREALERLAPRLRVVDDRRRIVAADDAP